MSPNAALNSPGLPRDPALIDKADARLESIGGEEEQIQAGLKEAEMAQRPAGLCES